MNSSSQPKIAATAAGDSKNRENGKEDEQTQDPDKRGEETSRQAGLKHVPVQCNGFALGLVGLSNVILNLHAFWFTVDGFGADIASAIASVFTALALFNQILYLAKIIAQPIVTWSTDFNDHAVVAGQMFFCTMMMFTTTMCRLAPNMLAPKKVLVGSHYVYVLLQPVMTARFYAMVRRDNNQISPIFFPHTVAVATIAITGGAVGVPVELLALSEWAGVITMVILFPIALHRALRNTHYMANPAIGMLQAAPSFCYLGYFSTRKVEGSVALLPDIVGDTLFALSVAGVIATAYCAIRRARVLRASWFSPPWAAFTFPSASSANVALARASTRSHPAATVYATVLCAIVIPLIIVINISHLKQLSQRVFGSVRLKKSA